MTCTYIAVHFRLSETPALGVELSTTMLTVSLALPDPLRPGAYRLEIISSPALIISNR